jgi:hypothetical protein
MNKTRLAISISNMVNVNLPTERSRDVDILYSAMEQRRDITLGRIPGVINSVNLGRIISHHRPTHVSRIMGHHRPVHFTLLFDLPFTNSYFPCDSSNAGTKAREQRVAVLHLYNYSTTLSFHIGIRIIDRGPGTSHPAPRHQMTARGLRRSSCLPQDDLERSMHSLTTFSIII